MAQQAGLDVLKLERLFKQRILLEINLSTDHDEVLMRQVPVRQSALAVGDAYVATVFDLLCANYGVDRGLGGENVAASFDDDVPYTPAWQERITGVKRDSVISVARAFARNAEKTKGKSMVILGAGINHWYHMDMTYCGIINMLVMCGCVGQEGGGWAHCTPAVWVRARSVLPIAALVRINRLAIGAKRKAKNCACSPVEGVHAARARRLTPQNPSRLTDIIPARV